MCNFHQTCSARSGPINSVHKSTDTLLALTETPEPSSENASNLQTCRTHFLFGGDNIFCTFYK